MPDASTFSVHCAVPRTPGDLAVHVPPGVETVLDCTCNDPARWAQMRAKGVKRIVALSRDGSSPSGADTVLTGDLPTLAAEGGALADLRVMVVISDGDLPRYRNPDAYMHAVKQALVPGGLFVLSTPNAQYHRAVQALAEEGWSYEQGTVWAREHLRFFTAVELKRLCASYGLEPLRATPLRSDPPEALPLDAQGYARAGRVKLGPLAPSEYQSFLAADMVCLAMRPAW